MNFGSPVYTMGGRDPLEFATKEIKMADKKLDVHEFWPNIPNSLEDFKKQHFNDQMTKDEWWEAFRKFVDNNTP